MEPDAAEANIIIDDSSRDKKISSWICGKCIHFHRTHRIFSKNTCDAFTGSIPVEIWRGDSDHRKPYPGDHGIQFEPINNIGLKYKLLKSVNIYRIDR